MGTLSLWQAISRDQADSHYPSLQGEIKVDVAIIGGGITGLTAAYHLVKNGKSVVILEAYRIGDGTTGNSTGNLYIETQPYFQNIKANFNQEIASLIAQSRKHAIDEIENNIKELHIDCNFSRRPWYLFAANDNDLALLDREVTTLKELSINIDYTLGMPLPFKFIKAAIVENQARFNPLKYVLGMAENLQKGNCQIFENSKVVKISEKNEISLATSNGKVIAKSVIIATHTPIGINPIQMYTAPYRSYVMAVRLNDDQCPEGHFWGVGDDQNISSTHSTLANNQPDLLLVAGRHHKTGQSHDESASFKALEQYLRNQISNFEIVHQWSAQHYMSADNIPYIGLANKSSKHIYMATGYFADGLIYGTIAAKILSDLILKNNDQRNNIYSSSRKTQGSSLGFLIKENFNVFLQYLKDWPSHKNSYSDLKPGEGRVVDINNEKCAVSRDEQNNLHIVSAVCTHMKCNVAWNNAEKTWDCPCHGSRFSHDGEVLEGPAIINLKRKNV